MVRDDSPFRFEVCEELTRRSSRTDARAITSGDIMVDDVSLAETTRRGVPLPHPGHQWFDAATHPTQDIEYTPAACRPACEALAEAA